MNIENFKPVVELAHLKEFKDLIYLKGRPLEYRFNASDGSFQTRMGKFTGKEFSLIPIAYKLGSPDLYGPEYEGKKWLELYFINRSGGVGCIAFHGYSVDNFEDNILATTVYANIPHPIYIKLIITPEKKEIKQREGEERKEGSYYIADWSFELIAINFATSLQTIVDNSLPIYKEKTALAWELADDVLQVGTTTPDEIKLLSNQ